MKVGQLREVLLLTESLYRNLGEENAANGIACFSNLLKGKKTETVSAFVSRVKRARASTASKNAAGQQGSG
jgi:hypothetical protein